MYDEKNLIHIFTILECCEKAWIYTKNFDNPIDFIWANEQKELNATISFFIAIDEIAQKLDMVNVINSPQELLKTFLNTPHYKHISYLVAR